MSNKETQEFTEKLTKGLELAEKRMLQEKASKGQSVVVCDDDNVIVYIPAEQVINDSKMFQ